MAEIVKKNFDHPEETRTVPNGTIEVVDLGELQAMRATFKPGWKWSESVKPVAGTDSCQVAHTGFMLSGKMIIKMDDGTEYTLNAGDAVTIPPGHDAWIVGDETCVFIDFQGASVYAKPQSTVTTA
jgi:quercetin dioxygenase-like cupin family protein